MRIGNINPRRDNLFSETLKVQASLKHLIFFERIRRLNFSAITQPFLESIKSIGNRLSHLKSSIIVSSKQKIQVVQEIFYRLIYPFPSYLKDPAFLHLIASVDQKKPGIEERVAVLFRNKFKQIPYFSRDLAYLRSLHKEISDILRQLNGYTANTQHGLSALPIHQEMIQLKQDYFTLQETLDSYLEKNTPAILNIFTQICDFFVQSQLPMPNTVRNELYKDWTILKTLVPQSSIQEDFLNQMNRIEMLCQQEGDLPCVIYSSHPLHLRNQANSCYIDSAMQAIFSLEEIRERLFNLNLEDSSIEELRKEIQSISLSGLEIEENQKKLAIKKERLTEKEHTLAKRKEIQAELIKLIKGEIVPSSITHTEYILSLLGGLNGPSIFNLRRLLVESKLNPEFNSQTLSTQLDSATVTEVFLDSILDCRGILKQINSTPDVPGRHFSSAPQPFSSLQVHLVPGIGSLKELIEHRFATEFKNDPLNAITVTPSEGIIVDTEAAAKGNILNLSEEIKTAQYEVKDRLTSLPDVMAIHLVRFNGGYIPSKNGEPVTLPADGIIDLSNYYYPAEGESKVARYEITGIVIHQGSLHGGHYVAHVKRENNYWYCNDVDNPPFKKESRENFFSQNQPYLLILKRMHERPAA